jgi:phytoene desaturase
LDTTLDVLRCSEEVACEGPEKAAEVLRRTGADAVMIGRAAQGRPWIFREVAHYLRTGERLAPPSPAEARDLLLGHLDALHAFYGEEQGVRILCNETVEAIEVKNGSASHVRTAGKLIEADFVVGAADYHHVEQHLLEKKHRQYSEKYWDNRSMAPSSLIYYLGIDKRIEGLEHHNLFFDKDFNLHAHQIYTNPQWPSDPLCYVCAPSKSDPTVAPEGCENIFILIPVAPDLTDTPEVRERYFQRVMERMESLLGQQIRQHVIYRRDYAHSDFRSDYNAFKGNAYGLANTLAQTAILKPKLKSPKVKNLYYAGQLTTPGPGVPPSLISGQVVARELIKDHLSS